jgi:hypothetical protein
MNIDKVIKIQKIIRGYLVRKLILIPNSKYQSKNWRLNQKWYKTGKNNECEKYQIKIINNIITKYNLKLEKTNLRINMESHNLVEIINPLKLENGYEFTENFDGLIKLKNYNCLLNLKFVCDIGGAQTRTLREVYHFIKYQIEILNKNNKYIFINILDGDTSYKNINKFYYLLNKLNNNKNLIFIGSLNEFQYYFHKNIYLFNK